MRLLVVEDEKNLNELLVRRLEREHYTVDSCLNGLDAEDCLACAEYDGILLDIMLPGRSGLEILRGLRGKGDRTPVLLLTARDAVEDRVKGLDAGADDYLVKPFALEELMARVRALVRRGPAAAGDCFVLDDLVVDCASRQVSRAGREIPLASKEFAVLEYLIRNQGVVLSREKIAGHIWNYSYEGGSNVVDVYIRYLRKKIDEGQSRRLIHTVRGAGYVLREET